MTTYQDQPWLAQLNEKQRRPIVPRPSPLHAFRDAVRTDPDHPALAYFDGRLTYREADELSDGIAGHLAERGFRPGDRLAIMLQNTPHFVLALLGAWKAGGTVVPVNPMYKGAELAHILGDAEVSALVCSRHGWEDYIRDTAAASPVRIALTADARDLQTRDDERVLRDQPIGVPEDTDGLVACILYTSPSPRDTRSSR
ncbi:AMP-binding protein, partial [Streptomyces sp. PRKS01-29]